MRADSGDLRGLPRAVDAVEETMKRPLEAAASGVLEQLGKEK